MNISTYYDLKVKQPELEFLDVKLNDDNKLFIDPKLMEINRGRMFTSMADALNTFFGNLVLFVSTNDTAKINYLLSGLKEPSETRLGYGVNNSNGRSSGPTIKTKLIESIKNNPVIKSRSINNLSELSFFIEDVGCDRISDMTTKIIKSSLIDFTEKQCLKHDIPTKGSTQKEVFDQKTVTWVSQKCNLPFYNNNGVEKTIIFVPKTIVGLEAGFNSNLDYFFRFARNFIIDKNDRTFLSGIPRNGKNNTIRKKDFNESIEDRKEEMSKWVVKHPIILSDYWTKSVDRIRSLTNDEIQRVIY